MFGEMQSLYNEGVMDYIADLWNIVDIISNMFYVTWIGLRFTSFFLVQVGCEIIRLNTDLTEFGCFTAGLLSWVESMVSARAMGSLRSDVAVWRCFCGRHDILILKVGSYLFDQSTSWSTAGVPGSHDHRYHQVFLHLYSGFRCFWLR